MKRMRRARYICGRRGGFSIAEVVVAMALIVLLSVTGFLACYTGLAIQNNANGMLAIRNAADGFYTAFSQTLSDRGGVTGDDAKKNQFILDFHENLAFVLGSYVPDVRGFSEASGYGIGQSWTVEVANKTRTDLTYTNNSDGTLTETETVVVLEGLTLTYDGTQNNTRYMFHYRYFTEQITIEATVHILFSTPWYLDISGYRAGSDFATYEHREVFE